MPYLALDTTYAPTVDERHACTESLTELYTEKMATTAGHVAVAVRAHSQESMSLGRAVDGPIAVLNADVRRGRPFEQRRTFGLAVVDWLEAAWNLPRPNVKVVFTEHEGHDLMGADRVGGEWSLEEES